MVLRESHYSKRIDVIDTYKKIQSKTVKDCCKMKETGHQLQSITSTQRVRQWRNFLVISSTKTSLCIITSMVSECKDTQHSRKHGDKVLYAIVGEECFKITSEEYVQVPYLQYTQEEADTRLLLHSAHVAID